MAAKRVLVIEENAVMRFALSRISLGPSVELEYMSMQDALLGDGTYATILADDSAIYAPGEKIPLAVLKERYATPVIIMTSSGNRRFEGYARQSGAVAVLFKPFNISELRKLISKFAGVEQSENAATSVTVPIGSSHEDFTPADFGGRIANDKVFDELYVELERRQPLQEGLDAFDVVERHLIKRALQTCEGNQSQAARFLGITRNTLRKRIRKYGFQGLISGDDKPDDDEP